MSALGKLTTAAELEVGAKLSSAEVAELTELITEHDGMECAKHDVIVRGAVRRAEELEKQVAALKVQLSEEYKDWMKEQCNSNCQLAERLYNNIVTELRTKIIELEAQLTEERAMADGLERSALSLTERLKKAEGALAQIRKRTQGVAGLTVKEIALIADAALSNKAEESSECMVGGHPPGCRGHVEKDK